MKKDKQRLSELSKFARDASFSERKDNDAGRFMNKSPQIYWKDKSGTSHRFSIYPRGTKFNEPCPGIYIYAREESPHKWFPIYIGQTKNLNVRLTNREQRECVEQNGATHIHISIITDEKSRFRIEKDLIEQWKKRGCNTQLVVPGKEQKPYPVRYDQVNTMLNEFLTEHRKVQEQDVIIAQLKKEFQAAIARQQKQIEVLTAGLQKVRGQLGASITSTASRQQSLKPVGVGVRFVAQRRGELQSQHDHCPQEEHARGDILSVFSQSSRC